MQSPQALTFVLHGELHSLNSTCGATKSCGRQLKYGAYAMQLDRVLMRLITALARTGMPI